MFDFFKSDDSDQEDVEPMVGIEMSMGGNAEEMEGFIDNIMDQAADHLVDDEQIDSFRDTIFENFSDEGIEFNSDTIRAFREGLEAGLSHEEREAMMMVIISRKIAKDEEALENMQVKEE